MSEKYFDAIGSLLTEMTSGQKLMFKSEKTGEITESTPNDTLVASDTLKGESSSSKWDIVIAHAKHDKTNARVKMQCSKCKTAVVMYLRLDNNKKIYYICTTCENIWSN